MAYYRFKAKLTDDIEDAKEIIRNSVKSIIAGHADKNALISNLRAAVEKLESAKYYVDRE